MDSVGFAFVGCVRVGSGFAFFLRRLGHPLLGRLEV